MALNSYNIVFQLSHQEKGKLSSAMLDFTLLFLMSYITGFTEMSRQATVKAETKSYNYTKGKAENIHCRARKSL